MKGIKHGNNDEINSKGFAAIITTVCVQSESELDEYLADREIGKYQTRLCYDTLI